MKQGEFAVRLIDWQQRHGRHDLPWQVSDPYRVWLSEIMLQQTQVASVLSYYDRFLQAFPTLAALAAASQAEVLALWSGLGYYSRARNLHRAAQRVMEALGGRFPSTRAEIELLPGVGRSTAAAIAAFAFDRREAILDGNVKRVLTRVFGIEGFPGDKPVENRLWSLAESLLPARDMAAYTQGLMDLGATVCLRANPKCDECPMAACCVARAEGRQAELPTRKAKKAVPVRQVMMLLAVWQGKVRLERRPDRGIWGGLLSLPECAGTQEAETWLAQQGEGDLLPSWPELVHVFTHFRLVITPQPIMLSRRSDDASQEAGACWLPIDEAIHAGVPAPVGKLLAAWPAGGNGK
ncbi:MAG: A/G-specific adenine glycosylase [Paludibacterium sp.]|uniref:A/G-specific adenine glycosylase n=1 Tax=Paludibacterium sp. TaxID=1917523 RepID=UPI0025D47E0F|nr:A/G-specific adenine glycosylase [Paludibacterium sp.]MBV8047994.1 A/G-specific adenine glycosylase [Paludibacterium sp.]MBV8649162.1 A/G-specific adenine glycosylase [Paludibacterium sp.]